MRYEMMTLHDIRFYKVILLPPWPNLSFVPWPLALGSRLHFPRDTPTWFSISSLSASYGL